MELGARDVEGVLRMKTTSTARVKELFAKRVSLGLCPQCGERAEEGRKHCASCIATRHAHNRAYRQRRLSVGHQKGVCTRCGRPRIGRTVWCDKHYYQHRADAALGTTAYADAIRLKLEQQQFRCYYTGQEIFPGVNDSLDHRLSVSKHPESRHDIDNVVWCLREINLMKNGMDEGEFIRMCQLIGAWHRDRLNASGAPVSLPTGAWRDERGIPRL